MENFKAFLKRYLQNSLCLCAALALILNFTIESLARQSVGGGLSYLIESPLVFFYNTLIIFTTLSVALFIKRRVFMYVVITGIWLTIGIINGVILSNRMTPFTTKDLMILEDGLTIVTNYLSVFQIVLAGAGVLLLIAAVVLVFILHLKKKRYRIKRMRFTFLLFWQYLEVLPELQLKQALSILFLEILHMRTVILACRTVLLIHG